MRGSFTTSTSSLGFALVTESPRDSYQGEHASRHSQSKARWRVCRPNQKTLDGQPVRNMLKTAQKYSAAGPSKWLWVAAVRTLLVPGPANCGLIHTYLRNSSLSSPRHATVKLQTARYNCGALHTKAVRDRESCILKSNSVPHGAYCSLSWVTSDEALILLSARLCV